MSVLSISSYNLKDETTEVENNNGSAGAERDIDEIAAEFLQQISYMIRIGFISDLDGNYVESSVQTSAEEILDNLFKLEAESFDRQKNKALRYWLAVIVKRLDFGENITHRFLSQKFNTPRTAIAIGLKTEATPSSCEFTVPSKKQHKPTSAEELVTCLSQMPAVPDTASEDTYSLRFWMAQAIYRIKNINNAYRSIEKIFDIDKSKIFSGVKDGTTPAQHNYKIP